MATDIAPDEKVHIHEEKIERLEHTIDNLKKAIEDLKRSQDEKLQHFEGRFQRLEGMHTGSASMKQWKGIRGPIGESVLMLQYDHRSAAIWRGQDFEPLTCRRCDGAFWHLGALGPHIQRLTIQAGFYGVYKARHIQLDHALITALVER